MSNVLERLDANLKLPVAEAMLLDSVRRLASDALRPNAARHDEAAEFPWESVRAINELGLNAMFIPSEYGGADCSYTAYLACCREISKACASTGIIWTTNFRAASPLVDFTNQEQKQRWLRRIADSGLAALALTESGSGSDATAIKTPFVPQGDEIVINGATTFIINGDVCDLLVMFGKWSELGEGKDAISLVVIEKGTPGFEVLRTENKMGMRGSSTAALSFADCRVPRANLPGAPGAGMQMLFDFLNKSRPSIAAHALEIARAAFEDAVAYIEDAVAYINERQPLEDVQSIQLMLADLATDLALCESWLWQLAQRIEGGERGLGQEASMPKMRASDLAMRIATDAVELHGGYGYTKNYRVEHPLRDAKITQIWEGTNQVHRQIIGRSFITH